MFEALFPRVSFRHPSRAWDHLAADCLGPLPSGEYLFTIVDYYSRWLEVVVMTKTTNADKVVKELDKLFTIYGLPASIATDNGPNNSSAGLTPVVECGVDLYIFKCV
jgi:hypothetical protein